MLDQEKRKNQENDWIQKLRLGEEKAFKEMFFYYYPKLFYFAKNYTNTDGVSDELVKDLFVDLWLQREQLIIHSSLKAYLYAATRNRALNALRKINSQQRKFSLHTIEDDELALIQSEVYDPLIQLENKELTVAVRRAIESLPGRCKLILKMHREDGLSYAEIAQVLQISIKTVENQMTRAFKLLRDRLSTFSTF